MVSFIGRSGHHVLFGDEESAVVVDARVSVVSAFGSLEELINSKPWGSGEFSDSDQSAAAVAFESMSVPVPKTTGRLYTVPKGVQMAAKQALSEAKKDSKFSAASLRMGETLASGGQIEFTQLVNIHNKLSKKKEAVEKASVTASGAPSPVQISWDLYGGNAAVKWAGNIVSRESVVASGPPDFENFSELLENSEAGPEFIARLYLESGDIDRLYRIDIDGQTYVWEDATWEDFGHPNWAVWQYDKYLDDAESSEVEDVTHVLIDPESAIYIAANLAFGRVYVDDINLAETRMAKEAAPELDWELLDRTVTAAGGTPGDGIYTPDERSENASSQVRDKTGKFAKQGGRVMVNGVPGATGIISRVNPSNGTVEIQMDSGETQVVQGNQVETVGQYTTTIPGKPVEVPRVDFSGILAEPRTPINRVQGQIPGTLPAMTPDDLHSVVNNFSAWVKSQREQFKQLGGPNAVGVQAKNSLDTGKTGSEIRQETGKSVIIDAYDHPLLNKWLNTKGDTGYHENRLWYRPIVASAEPMTPEQSDVQPVYMAVVSPEDPRAVFKLISLVPASTESTVPAVYAREDGQWVLDAQTLNELRSATPPPVVPLNSDALNDVLIQVDDSQGESAEKSAEDAQEDAEALDAPLPDTSALPPGAPDVSEVVVASGVDDLDFNLMVLWGPKEHIMQQALAAAGGLDRNRGGAEKLRRYWTKGPGAAKIVWGTPGDWTRCVRYLGKYMGPRAKGYCALRHKEVTGMWTGDREHRQVFSANYAGKLHSTELVESSENIVNASVLKVRSQIAKNRVVTASAGVVAGFETIYDTAKDATEGITAAAWDERVVGGAFWMPIALPEGVESGDGRFVEEGAAEIRTLPISLLWQFRTASGHEGSVVVGRIERLRRIPGGIGNGYGHFDTGPWGREAERMVRNGMLRFVSADMDKFGAVKDKPEAEDAEASDKEDIIEADKVRVKKARVMAVTIVAKPAFQEATIQIVPDEPLLEEEVFPDGIFADEPDPMDVPAILAAGYIAEAVPVIPPRTWFNKPSLSGPTPLTVTDDGQVFGHIAAWNAGHINPRLNGINPPHSKSGYSYFHTGVLRTEEGDIPVGQLTLAGGHAGLEASAAEAVKHYDDTGSAIADVHAGEDSFGIWVSGALRPGVTAEQIRAFRASAPSGDWRPIRGALELVAVCQVNVPGFPMARAFVASGEMTALVAAGALPLAKMQSDPISELSARLEKIEAFEQSELSAKAAAIRTRVEPTLSKQRELLQARAESVFSTMETFGYVPKKTREKAAEKGEALPDGSFPVRNVADLKNAVRAYGRAKDSDQAKVRKHIMKRARVLGREDLIPAKWSTAKSDALTASVEQMRSRISELREFNSTPTEDELRKLAEEDTLPKGSEADEGRPKYTPGKDQPRDYRGQFRDVLARLSDNLGTSGNQGVVDKIKETDAKIQTGDYVKAVEGAMDLRDTLDRLDEGVLDATSLANVRESAKNLGTVISNMPLPFNNQAAKVRFSDLPPALGDLVKDLVDRVGDKIKDSGEAAAATSKLKSFMSGSDVFSQSEISAEMSKMLRLLT